IARFRHRARQPEIVGLGQAAEDCAAHTPRGSQYGDFQQDLCSHPLEKILHAVEPGPRARAVALAASGDGFLERPKLFLLAGREVDRRLDLNTAEQVTESRSSNRSDPFALQPE